MSSHPFARATVSGMALAASLARSSPALAQTAATAAQTGPGSATGQATPDQPAVQTGDSAQDSGEAIVVPGFRESLNKSLPVKRREVGVVDTFMAEDIGKFPDSNLAESKQRLPGVAITRAAAGEDRPKT